MRLVGRRVITFVGVLAVLKAVFPLTDKDLPPTANFLAMLIWLLITSVVLPPPIIFMDFLRERVL